MLLNCQWISEDLPHQMRPLTYGVLHFAPGWLFAFAGNAPWAKQEGLQEWEEQDSLLSPAAIQVVPCSLTRLPESWVSTAQVGGTAHQCRWCHSE